MKKIYTLCLLVLLPGLALAAYNDVTLQGGDTIINTGGIDLTVMTTSAVVESITVNSNNFVFVLQPGSSLGVTSADRRVLSHDAPGSVVTTSSCTATESALIFSIPGGSSDSATVTVTPGSSTCSGGATTSSGGGGPIVASSGGGGGGGSTTPAPAPAPAPTPAPTFVFTRNLSVGMSGNDVKELQKILVSEGVYPQAIISGYFGSLTRAAVQKFQAKYGITATGYVGPLTRAKLNSLSSVTASPVQTTPVSITFTRGLGLGSRGEDVKELQKILNREGVYPENIISGYFGRLTEAAVKKFQEKYNIAGPGVTGYGYVGPKTRAKLNSL